MSKPNPMGATFAERAAAAAGKASFDAPDLTNQKPEGNSTFGERAGRGKKAPAKQVKADEVEDKAVTAKKTSKKS
jgi:hypothetical protein